MVRGALLVALDSVLHGQSTINHDVSYRNESREFAR
jgi:hypothetical protein